MWSSSFALAAGSLLVSSVANAQCPDFLDYAQAQHTPLSTGKYALSYMRPDPSCRTFNSSIVEATIADMEAIITDPDLYRLFENSFPNTLDTAVKFKGYATGSNGTTDEELTFLITGDM